MGAKASKNPQEEEEEENRVHEPYLIQWDEFGHLRYGQAHKIDPGRQMVEIMELDFVDDIVRFSHIYLFLMANCKLFTASF